MEGRGHILLSLLLSAHYDRMIRAGALAGVIVIASRADWALQPGETLDLAATAKALTSRRFRPTSLRRSGGNRSLSLRQIGMELARCDDEALAHAGLDAGDAGRLAHATHEASNAALVLLSARHLAAHAKTEHAEPGLCISLAGGILRLIEVLDPHPGIGAEDLTYLKRIARDIAELALSLSKPAAATSRTSRAKAAAVPA